MRKILLASTAMLGATVGIASAQAPQPAAAAMMMQPTQGQFALPWAQGPTVNNNNNTLEATNYVGSSKYGANAVPPPGTVVIRLNGRVQAEAMGVWSTNHQLGSTAVTGLPGQGAAAGTPTLAGAKTNALTLDSYVRLYPGVDGMATNGLRYGAAVEIRVNTGTVGGSTSLTGATGGGNPSTVSAATFSVLPTGATLAANQTVVGSAGAGTGANIVSTAGTTANQSALGAPASSPGAYNLGQTLYVRRAFAYLAHDNLGLMRIGVTDGVIGLFDTGIFSAAGANFDGGLGGLNGAGPQGNGGVTGAFAVPYVLSQTGAEYSNVKIVYLTPQFFGFDFGVQYAPSMGNGASTCAQAGFACNAATSGNDPTRWYNQVAVGARWQGVFGPVAAGVYGVYETAGKETFFGTSQRSGRGYLGTRYDNLGFVSAGTYLVYNSPVGAFTAALTYQGGAVNTQLAMKPEGGVNQNQFVGGVMWRNGPITVGTQVNFLTSQGDARLVGVSQRREFALAVGGAYALAPGLSVFAEYQYAYRHQGGYNFIAGSVSTGAPGSTALGTTGWKAGATRDAHGQAIVLGTAVGW